MVVYCLLVPYHNIISIHTRYNKSEHDYLISYTEDSGTIVDISPGYEYPAVGLVTAP